MCGIVGLFAKTHALRARVGTLLADMLIEMSDRGPDSAGVALYRDPAPEGTSKVVLFHPDADHDWSPLAEFLGNGNCVEFAPIANHALFRIDAPPASVVERIPEFDPEVSITSAGEVIEIYKDTGRPAAVVERYGLRQIEATHALGHTRMATESAVTTEHSHPFSTGLDLCLVHNGSLSNHNRLRETLQRRGMVFHTDNDSEVAAGYLTYQIREGATLEQALQSAIADLDGFYTFAIGTRDGFAVLRDPIACKPAVLAETDDWVAMSSEYRAIAKLPGAESARTWEPEPGIIYSWSRS